MSRTVTPRLYALAMTMLSFAPLVRASAQTKPPAPASGSAIRIPFEKYTLPNGLTVVLSEEHATPTVVTDVIYHVGSKNELVGHTGFAHMFEHVMFTGSGHVPYGLHDKFTEGVGGSNNGQTYFDWTRYWDTDPANYLETALWLEADRMGFLLDSLDETKFRAQRDIVKNERRQSYDNQPYRRDAEILGVTMYPQGHPHSWPTIGAMADLSAASVEDVKQFFRLYYAPNNATLVIVGDFDPKQAKAWIAKYFGDIPRGKPITRPKVPAAVLSSEKRITFEDRVQVPRLHIQWPTVNFHNDDQYALDVLSDILTGSRIARLTKEMVYDKQSATSVGASHNAKEAVGEFDLVVTPRPGHTLTEMEDQADAIIETLKRDGPTADELKRAKAGLELSFLNELQSNLNKAFRLANDQVFFNDPTYSITTDFPKTQAVTAADVKRVANKYLGKARIVLSDVPIGKLDLAARADKSTVVTDPYTEKTTEIKP